jgi:hypothetical protein
LSVGNRREVTKAEAEELALSEKADEVIESGDPNWLDKIKDMMGDDLDSLDISEEFLSEIEEEEF